jgi:ArsR family transcriptional regulator
MPVQPDPLSARRIGVLKAIAHPSRLLITEALMDGERCVQELRDMVGDDLSTVSKHLSILRSAGVLVSQKRSQNVFYALACDCFGDFLQCVDRVCRPPKISRRKKAACCPPFSQ